MALKVTKVEVWAGDLRDVPGGLADVLEQTAAGGQSRAGSRPRARR